jgi:hypothetical protein
VEVIGVAYVANEKPQPRHEAGTTGNRERMIVELRPVWSDRQPDELTAANLHGCVSRSFDNKLSHPVADDLCRFDSPILSPHAPRPQCIDDESCADCDRGIHHGPLRRQNTCLRDMIALAGAGSV